MLARRHQWGYFPETKKVLEKRTCSMYKMQLCIDPLPWKDNLSFGCVGPSSGIVTWYGHVVWPSGMATSLELQECRCDCQPNIAVITPSTGKAVLTAWTSAWMLICYCQSVHDLLFLTYLCHTLKADTVLHFYCTQLVMYYGPLVLRWSWLPNVEAARLFLDFLGGFFSDLSSNNITDW